MKFDENKDDDVAPNPDRAVYSEALELNQRREKRLQNQQPLKFLTKGAAAFRPGQNVRFVVEDVVSDGCEVTILKNGWPAFIRTSGCHSIGELGIGIFVCVNDGRCLLSEFDNTWTLEAK